MQDNKYNGWTNYATWRVNLEIFDGMDCSDLPMLSRYSEPDPNEVAEYLKEYAEEIICTDTDRGLCQDYALAFLGEVNWYEIGQHFIDTWKDIVAEEMADSEAEND